MRPIKKYCRALCPQRHGCKRYLSREALADIKDMSEIETIGKDPYDYKRLFCKLFISKGNDGARGA